MPEVQMRTECWTRVAPGKKRKDGLKQGQDGLAGKGAGKRRSLKQPSADFLTQQTTHFRTRVKSRILYPDGGKEPCECLLIPNQLLYLRLAPTPSTLE